MRIEAVSSPHNQSAVHRAEATGVPDQLQPGTRVQAQVLSREGDTVQLRLEGGAELTARLEGGAFLAPGQEVRLLVTSRDEQSVTLSLERGGTLQGEQPQAGPQSEAVRILNSLRLPVSDAIVQRMERLLRDNPGLPADRAAFLAANEIEDPRLVRAALRLMEQGATTGRMLERLLELLPQPSAQQAVPPQADLQEPAAQQPPQTGEPAGPPPEGVPQTAGPAPAEAPRPHPPAQTAPPEQTAQTPLAEPLQAIPVQEPQPQQLAPPQPQEATQEVTAEQLLRQALDQAVEQRDTPQEPVPAAPPTQSAQTAQTVQSTQRAPTPPADWVALLEQLLGAGADEPQPPLDKPPGAQPPATAEQPPSARPQETDGRQPPQAVPAPGGPEAPADGARRILSLLAATPALAHLPERGLQQLSTLLERVVAPMLRELQEAPDTPSALRRALEGLFASLDRDGDAAQQLRQAKEELYLKLSVLRDAVRRSDLAEKPALLEETQRLMDHLRSMSEMRQVVYLQVPLRMENRHETAELYIFKNSKNGRSRIDPEDVRILLALDLQHMGHLESMLHVRGREVSLSMELETDEAVAFTQRETPRLYRMLDAAGFKLTDAKVTCAATRTAPEGALQALLRHEWVRPGCDLTI